MDFNGRSRSAGVHPHRRCRGFPRGRLWRRLPRGWLAWRRLVRRWWLFWRLWLGVLRLRLGRIGWARLAGLLRRLLWLRICAGLLHACVLRSGVCRASLQHASLRHDSLHETSLHQSRLYEDAGLCDRSPCDLCCPGLRHGSAPGRTSGCSRHLRPGPNRAGLDAAACPASKSDLQLDSSAEHDCILRHAVAGEGIAQGEALPPSVIGADAVIRDRAATEMGRLWSGGGFSRANFQWGRFGISPGQGRLILRFEPSTLNTIFQA